MSSEGTPAAKDRTPDAEEPRTYLCIDMKTFYASVECAERGLNPFEQGLVVADATRGKNALCLAVSPKMKSLGIHNRCRLSDIPASVEYITAPPRMQRYIDYAADIYAIYLEWFSPEDIHVYSIDESFIDATNYLPMYKTDGETLAKKLMNEIAERLGIPSTAGIGTNLYLAKVALDITAKYAKDHIAFLNERLYRERLWDHEPITDFWQVADGIAARLERRGIYTMRGIAEASETMMYKVFGVNAELLIDHAYGQESCRISDIKAYIAKSRSVSSSQILPKDYGYDEALTVLTEMVIESCLEMMRRHVVARRLWIGVSYSLEMEDMAGGMVRINAATAADTLIRPKAAALFSNIASRTMPIRRLAIAFRDLVEESCEGYDLFTDWAEMERKRTRDLTVLELKDRFGKNAVLRGIDFAEGATQRERNEMIGGHRAGYDDAGGTGAAVHTV